MHRWPKAIGQLFTLATFTCGLGQLPAHITPPVKYIRGVDCDIQQRFLTLRCDASSMHSVRRPNTANAQRQTAVVLSTPIDIMDWVMALDRIDNWAANRESRYICICNAHSVVTATQDPSFLAVLKCADMATPDGTPVAWMIRRLHGCQQQRINGPDLMLKCCERSAASKTSVYLLGSSAHTLLALQNELARLFPALRIAGANSPPFRPLSDDEDHALVAEVNASGAGVVFVSLGCPKQERWMAAHRGRVHAVMIGVGAAFDFHSGTVGRAPVWMQHNGLEWLHRLFSEPRRLWRRYLVTNTLFLWGAARQLFVWR